MERPLVPVALLALLLANTLSVPVSIAQSAPPAPPQLIAIDRNHIDLANQRFEPENYDLTIGTADSGMSLKSFAGSTVTNNFDGYLHIEYKPIAGNGGALVATAGVGQLHVFRIGTVTGSLPANYFVSPAPGPYQEEGGGPATLSCTGQYQQLYAGGICSVYLEDGSEIKFEPLPTDIIRPGFITAGFQFPSQIIKPDGELLTFHVTPASSGQGAWISGVSSSLGFEMRRSIDLSTTTSLTNATVDYCAPLSPCSIGLGTQYESQTTNGNIILIYSNGSLRETHTFTYAPLPWAPSYTYRDSVTISKPSGASQFVHYSPPTQDPLIITSTIGGNTTTYSFNDQDSPTFDINVTNPSGSVARHGFDNGKYIFNTNELGQSNVYTYTGAGVLGGVPRLAKAYRPDSPALTTVNGDPYATALLKGLTSYAYTHGALSTMSVIPVDNSPTLTTTVGLASSCTPSSYKTCNKPEYVIDARGNRTDYTYDPVHGGILTETAPADADGVRPQKRFTYSLLYPQIRNASGVLVNSTPVWRVTRISECLSATSANPASCIGSAQERVTTYAYNTANLFKTSETVAMGDGSLSATTSSTYDAAGNVTSVDGPRTDVDDKRYTTWDTLRRPIFEIGPDPDASGPLPRPIVHHVYDGDGREWKTEEGTGNAVDGSDFVVSRYSRTTFDAASGYPVKKEVVQP